MRHVLPDLRAVAGALAASGPWALAPGHLAGLRGRLGEARRVPAGEEARLVDASGRTFGRVRRCGSVVLYAGDLSGPAAVREGAAGRPRRLVELDRRGHVTLAIRRRDDGTFVGAAVRAAGEAWIGVSAGGARHPLWGASDRILGLHPAGPAGEATPLTVARALDWDGIDAVPPLAEPARLPPGAGTAVLALLAALARDQGRPALRYRGPFPTEQLFWALTETFHSANPSPDLPAVFTRPAEDAFASGQSVEPPVDWVPAPPERLFLPDGTLVHLRDGVETVRWEGRTYHRPDWHPGRPDLGRRGHRVIRVVRAAGGERRFVLSLVGLGVPLEDHLVLDETGEVLDRPALPPAAARGPDQPLAPAWRDALGALVPLAATPLLGTALDAVWPARSLVWGDVPRDLAETEGSTVRLSRRLAAAHAARRAGADRATGRDLARLLVQDVLDLVGPPLRQAAAGWLEAQPAGRQAALLDAAARVDRAALAARAAGRLGRLLDALAAGEALPS